MKICYSANISGYDTITKPFHTKGWEYVLYTDQDIKAEGWTVVRVPEQEDKVRQARKIKICPPFDAEESIWFDARFSIIGDLNKMIQGIDGRLAVTRHPIRQSLSEEFKAVADHGKDNSQQLSAQRNRYLKEGFMPLMNLPATGILYRRGDTKKFNEAWMNEVIKYSHRDQLSFQFSSWKTSTPFEFIEQSVYSENSPYFKLGKHKWVVWR